MASAPFLLKVVLGVIGVVMAVLSVQVLRIIDRRSDSAMTSLQFYREETIGDFLLFVIGTTPLFIGFLLYAAGGFLEIEALINLGRLTGVIASSIVVIVLYRWRGRF